MLKADSYALYTVDLIAQITGTMSPVAFNFVNFHNQQDASIARSAGAVHCRYGSDRFHHALKLALSMEPNGSIAGMLDFEPRHFSAEQIQRLAFAIRKSLQALSAESEAELSLVP